MRDNFFLGLNLVKSVMNKLLAFIKVALIITPSVFVYAALAQNLPRERGVLEIYENGIHIGDSLPSTFWDQTLVSYDVEGNSKMIKLGDFRNKLLVLDFWATYCVPCVNSLDKWNIWQHEFAEKVQVLAIHLYDYNRKVLPFAKSRNWAKLPLIYGNEQDTVINRLFYYDRSYGQIWIKDGKLFAIPLSSELKVEDIDKAIRFDDRPRQNLSLTFEEIRQKNGN